MFKSIKWRFIVIYFMLVFIGMVISGIFIIQSIEQYNYVNIDNRIDSISNIVLPRISEYDDLNDNAVEIQQILNTYSGFGFREEIFVIDIDSSYTILATNSENRGRNAIDILDFDLIKRLKLISSSMVSGLLIGINIFSSIPLSMLSTEGVLEKAIF